MLISQKHVYAGKVVQLNLEQVLLPNGVECELEIIHHPGGVAIVAMNAQQEICLLRQYRHAAAGWLWELPAGKIDNREDTLLTARRELSEEVGAQAASWHYLGKAISSPGVFTEVIHLYFATELTHVEQALESEEVLEVHWFKLSQVVDMIQAGDLFDAKSVIAIFYLQLYLNSHAPA